MNLVINAAEAIPEDRQGTVSVRAYTRHRGGSTGGRLRHD